MTKQSPRSLVRTAACVALSLSLASAASADESDDFARKGPYMEWAVSYAHFVGLEDELAKSRSGVEVTAGVGGDITVGYRFTKNLALDGQFTYVGIGDAEINGRSIAQFEHYTLMTSGRFYMLTGRIQPFAVVGLGFQHAEIDKTLLPGVDQTTSGFAYRVGGGIDFYLNRRFALTTGVTYTSGAGKISDFDTLQARAGWMFRF